MHKIVQTIHEDEVLDGIAKDKGAPWMKHQDQGTRTCGGVETRILKSEEMYDYL